MSARRILWVDATAGAAGDMILGALIDLGVPQTRIREALRSLPLSGWTLSAARVRRGGLAARKATVRVRDDHPGRNWREIRRIIRAGALDRSVRDSALSIFRRLIEAEAEVHGTTPDRVHLHEAGAVDAIVDVVGAAIGLAHLEPDRIVVSPLTTGHGTVRCRHGVYPVPAPATTLLIRGVPVSSGEVAVERLTPTGAAILTTVADEWGPLPPMTPLEVGYGAGDRDLGEHPNTLRMILGEAPAGLAAVRAEDGGEALVVEFSVDDAPPQVLAYAVERLFGEGALEVYTSSVHMKKGRSGQLITVLARPGDLARLAETVLRETTTLGMRYRRERRIELDRSSVRVRTPYGSVRVKVGALDGEVVQAWPEYEDCAALARRRGVPLKEIQQAALQTWRARRRRPVRKEPR